MSTEKSLTSVPVCPSCGHQHEDWWEWKFSGPMEGAADRECDSCGATFRCEREVSVYFTTTSTTTPEPTHDS